MRNSITCIKRMAAAGLAVLLALAILLAGGTTTALAAGPGIVVAWGDNTFGQLNVPAGLNDAIAIAAGYGFSLALKRDGTVVAWGYNTPGQLNVPADVRDVVAIAADGHRALALKRDGTVTVQSYNDGSRYYVPISLRGVAAIAAGDNHSLALVSSDTTTPSISARIDGTRGNEGWYTGDVRVSWNLVEDESLASRQRTSPWATPRLATLGLSMASPIPSN